MTKPLSMDLRERLLSAVEGGMSRRSAAKLFSIAPSTAIKWVDQQRRTGDVRPRAQGGDHRSHRLEAHADELLALVRETKDLTLSQLASHLDETYGMKVAKSTIWRLLDRHDMTYKKNSARRRTAAA
jgi:transposase